MAQTQPVSSPARLRILISSPGDVLEERDGARRVIAGLQRAYPGVTLEPVLWEELALPVTASFQQTIDFLLERNPIDIAVFILWSRLGSPLGASITRPDGKPFRSGTERELHLMLTAYEQSGKRRPVILAYVRDDDAAFKQRLTQCPKIELEELIDQQKLAEAFIREQFQDAQGRNLRAYQTYREPVGFVQRLRLHLRQAIDDLLGADATPTWTDEPYRGLQVFDLCHAPIFYGRDEETCELLQRIRDQQQAGCAFVVIVGASGSGKSSLARAGVAASLVHHAGDDDTKQWREITLLPALAANNLCGALVQSIADRLPELRESEGSLDDIAGGLAENASLTVRLSINPAFTRAAEQSGGKVRLLIVLDQMEELWTDRQTTSEDRESFLRAIEALAQSGHVVVLATLRSDFYPHAQQMPTFLRLKGERGHFDLLPPEAASVHRLITEPARLAGLRFERNEAGQSLEKIILDDAMDDPGALPLLQYALAELYQLRDQPQRRLTLSAYEQLGGVEGALGKRANQTFESLPKEARDALDDILPLLVTVDVGGEQSAVRRRASLDDLTSTPAREALTQHLIDARFLTSDRQDETPVASFAHEALLRRWPRVVAWIEVHRDLLRHRTRVEQSQRRWEQGQDESLLLPTGLPMDEAKQLLAEAPYLVSDATADFIRTSVDYREQVARKSRRLIRAFQVSAAAMLSFVLIGGAVAIWQIGKQKQHAVAAQSSAVKAFEEKKAALDAERAARSFAEQSKDLEIEARKAVERSNRELQEAKKLAEEARQIAQRDRLVAEQAERESRMSEEIAKIAQQRAEYEQFVSSIALAEARIRNREFSDARRVLVDLRSRGRATGWEWRLLWAQANQSRAVAAPSPALPNVKSDDPKPAAEPLKADDEPAVLRVKSLGDEMIYAAQFSPDGRQVIAASSVLPPRLLQVDPESLRFQDAEGPEDSLGGPTNQEAAAQTSYSFDGRLIATTGFKEKRIGSQAGPILVAGDTIGIWNAMQGRRLTQISVPNTRTIDFVTRENQWSKYLLASGGDDGTVRLWRPDRDRFTLFREYPSDPGDTKITCVRFSPDGGHLLAVGTGGYIRLWDLRQPGSQVAYEAPQRDTILCCAFSLDGNHVAVAGGRIAYVWPVVQEREPIPDPIEFVGHADWIEDLAWTPNRLLTASRDKSIRVWDPQWKSKGAGSAERPKGRELLALRRHTRGVRAIDVSPDGRLMLTAGDDGKLILWPAAEIPPLPNVFD